MSKRMKRSHLKIGYAVLWILTTGLFLLVTGAFRQISGSIGQAGAIAWFTLLFGPLFFVLYLLTAFLFDVRDETVTAAQFRAFLHRRRLLVGLFVFSLIVFVLLSFYGVSFKR
jgi:FtsH-binding integral membrane protein